MSSRALVIGLALLAILGALGGFAVYVRQLGYQDGFAAASKACEAEKRRIEDANSRAITEADRELMRSADRLSVQKMEFDHAVSGIDQASMADPDGALLCLGADSVQRLNAIR